ncbi:CaiF/GrlA family transcriptional regulator, partial [Salmonella enterica subsp. enterica]|nr:CaiF/GrlA family transcriptional regulator [Salmonella enterica subsp. enterica serovar Potsdam]
MKETSLPARHHRHPGPYTLPSGMSVPDGEDTPLYLLVARWAVIQNRPLTSRDISEAFHIINRRASDIMLYISRLPDSVLTSHLLWLHPDGESRRRAIRVTAVYGRPAPVE